MLIQVLDEVVEGKYKYPHKVYKVPVQAYFLNHFIVTAFLVSTHHGIDPDNDIQYHSAEYVETVETCYDKEQGCKWHWAGSSIYSGYKMHMTAKTQTMHFSFT